MAASTGTRVTGPRRRARALGVGGGVGVLVLVLGGCGSADVDDAPVEKKAFPLSGKTLTIDNDDSAVELVAADVKDVEVTRRVDGWVFMGSGPEATWKMKDGKLTLRMKCSAVASDCEARHTVKVPRDVTVTVENDNGAVTATGLRTPLKVRSDNGKIDVRNSSGALDLGSDNGKVVTQRVTAKSVRAHSGNGKVEIGLGAVPDKVDAGSDNGQILIELPGAGAPYAVTAKSDNGKVDVDVPTDKSSSHVVTAESDNGKVTVRSAN